MISILLAVHNGEKFLLQSINSIINQTFSNFELLIGFNGTIDSSISIVENINDNRIRIFKYDWANKAKTLNNLLLSCNYDIVAIQDDDDIWLPTKLEKQIQYINSYDIVGTLCSYINEHSIPYFNLNLPISHQDIFNNFFKNKINSIVNMSACFKKKLAIEVGGWDENIIGIEDFDFWIKMLLHGAQCINIQEYLVYHRIHNNSNFNTKKWNIDDLYKKYNL